MSKDLIEFCAREVESHVRQQFRRNRAHVINLLGPTLGRTVALRMPYLGFWYAPCDDAAVLQYEQIVMRALAWRERFRRTKPSWATDLPVKIDAIEKLRRGTLRLSAPTPLVA
jgi:hypothetical protein